VWVRWHASVEALGETGQCVRSAAALVARIAVEKLAVCLTAHQRKHIDIGDE
jgi:hypothetical protein